MEKMRESWTDKRLDDFSARVDHRFDAVDKRFDAVDQRFDAVDKRFESLERRTLMGFGGAVIIALLGIIATQL